MAVQVVDRSTATKSHRIRRGSRPVKVQSAAITELFISEGHTLGNKRGRGFAYQERMYNGMGERQ